MEMEQDSLNERVFCRCPEMPVELFVVKDCRNRLLFKTFAGYRRAGSVCFWQRFRGQLFADGLTDRPDGFLACE
ncbi:hypothetical protein [Chlorobaculum limnaeum]|uniref:hypothetical protein n=1 Tax=Chlorobaculum limnaeum TaxID=274537 RepID=UPI0012ECDE97|nr:hypothetical protein [Chlorobaculum limnaeum]